MTVKLGGIELNVERVRVSSDQVAGWIRVAGGKAVVQDWGLDNDRISLSCWIPAEESFSTFERIKGLRVGREPVILRVDENSWEVVVEHQTGETPDGSAGELDFSLELRVTEEPQTLVFVVRRELAGPDNAAVALEAMRQRVALAFAWRGIADRVAGWVNDAVVRVAELRDLLVDVVDLASVPGDVLGSVRRGAEMVVTEMGSLGDAIEEQFDSGARKYDEPEAAMLEVLTLARQVRTEMALLVAVCQAVPRNEQVVYSQHGDTLVSVAARLNRERTTQVDWTDIARANGIEELLELEAGTELVVPG